jgi:transposase-like protein
MSKKSEKTKFVGTRVSLNARCGNCQEEILQKNPEKCPYCGSTNLVSTEDVIPEVITEIEELKRAGKYEDAALKYEEIEMWDKAEEIRKSNVGKVSAVTMECPHCGASQVFSSKSNNVKCKNCGKNYSIPKKVIDLL